MPHKSFREKHHLHFTQNPTSTHNLYMYHGCWAFQWILLSDSLYQSQDCPEGHNIKVFGEELSPQYRFVKRWSHDSSWKIDGHHVPNVTLWFQPCFVVCAVSKASKIILRIYISTLAYRDSTYHPLFTSSALIDIIHLLSFCSSILAPLAIY